MPDSTLIFWRPPLGNTNAVLGFDSDASGSISRRCKDSWKSHDTDLEESRDVYSDTSRKSDARADMSRSGAVRELDTLFRELIA